MSQTDQHDGATPLGENEGTARGKWVPPKWLIGLLMATVPALVTGGIVYGTVRSDIRSNTNARKQHALEHKAIRQAAAAAERQRVADVAKVQAGFHGVKVSVGRTVAKSTRELDGRLDDIKDAVTRVATVVDGMRERVRGMDERHKDELDRLRQDARDMLRMRGGKTVP